MTIYVHFCSPFPIFVYEICVFGERAGDGPSIIHVASQQALKMCKTRQAGKGLSKAGRF